MQLLQTQRHTGNVAHRMMKAAVFVTGGRFLLRLLSLVSLMILARLLSPADYGIAALAMTAVGLLQILSDIRISQAIIGIEHVTREHLDTAFTLAMLRSAVIAGGLFFGAELFAHFMKQPALVDVLRVLAIVAFADGLKNPAFTLYRRNIDFSREVKRQAVATVVSTIVTIAAGYFLRSYWAIIIGTLALRYTETVFTYIGMSYRPRFAIDRWREFTSFGLWLTLVGLCDYIAISAPQFVIGRGLDAVRLGIFTVGREISAIAARELAEPLRAIIFPGLSAIAGDPARLRIAYREVQSTIFGITLPLGLGCAMLAEHCILILAGAKWLSAAPIIEVMAPSTALLMINMGADSLAVALGRSREYFSRSLIVALLSYPLLTAGLMLGGLHGVVYALAVRNIVSVVVTAWFSSRLAGDSLFSPLIACWRSFVAGGIMCAVLAYAKVPVSPQATSLEAALAAAPLVALGALVYVAVHFCLWRLTGRPQGLETRVFSLGRAMLAR